MVDPLGHVFSPWQTSKLSSGGHSGNVQSSWASLSRTVPSTAQMILSWLQIELVAKEGASVIVAMGALLGANTGASVLIFTGASLGAEKGADIVVVMGASLGADMGADIVVVMGASLGTGSGAAVAIVMGAAGVVVDGCSDGQRGNLHFWCTSLLRMVPSAHCISSFGHWNILSCIKSSMAPEQL